MTGKLKNLTSGVTFGIINKLVSVLLPFASRTVLIYTLGIEYIGLNSVFSSILQVLNFTELGLGSTIVYFLYKPLAEDDTVKVRNILAFCKKCYRLIGCIILGIGIALVPFLPSLINGTIPDNINLYVLYFLNLANSVVGYLLFAHKQTLLIAVQRVDLVSISGIISEVFLNLIQIITLLITKNFYLFTIFKIVASIVNNLCYQYFSSKYYSDYFEEGNIQEEEKKEFAKKIGGMFFQRISNVVLVSADSIVISAFLDLKTLGIYNSYYYVINGLVLMIGVIDMAILPVIGEIAVTKSKAENKSLFYKLDCGVCFIVFWFSLCYFLLCQDFMKLWIGVDNILIGLFPIVFASYFFFYRIKDAVSLYVDATGLWWSTKWVSFGAAMLNLVSNIIMVQFIGLYGILLSSIFSFIIVDIPFSTYKLFALFFEDKTNVLSYVAKRFILFGLFVATAFGMNQVLKLIKVTSIIEFILKLAIVGVLSFAASLFIFKWNPRFNEIKQLGLSKLSSYSRRGKK